MTAFAVSWALLAFAPARGDAAPHHVPPTESPTTTHGPSPTRTGPNDTDIAPALPAADTSHLMLPFDVSFPGASGTSLFDINDRGAVVGNYLTADGNLDGFVFQDGKFTDFTLPGATGGAELVGIGNDGNSVGDFGDGTGRHHGILRAADGTVTVLPDPPGFYNFPKDVNLQGVIVGNYFGPGCTGYSYRAGKYRPLTIDLPVAGCVFPNSINDWGQIVGNFRDATGVQHAFMLSPRHDCDGDDCDEYAGAHAEDISVPGIGTIAWSINDREQIVGAYRVQGTFFDHGFIRQGPKLRTLDFPGFQADTTLLGIDDSGIIVGTYGGFSFGLLAVPLDR